MDDFSAGALAAADGESIAACPWGPTEVEGRAWRQGWFHGEQSCRQAAGTFDHTAEFYEELARSENRAEAPTDPVVEILGGYDQDTTAGRMDRLLDRVGINPQPDVVWKVSIPAPSFSVHDISAAVARLHFSIDQEEMPEPPSLSVWFDDRSMLYATPTVDVEETIRQLTP